MAIFRQLGDPVAAAECLCQHHGAAYAEHVATVHGWDPLGKQDEFANGAVIVSQAITITERCCVVVNAAVVSDLLLFQTQIDIERPHGTDRTTQEDTIDSDQIRLHHIAAWEVLDPGTYTYEVVNRAGATKKAAAAWIKIIASDCEG